MHANSLLRPLEKWLSKITSHVSAIRKFIKLPLKVIKILKRITCIVLRNKELFYLQVYGVPSQVDNNFSYAKYNVLY